MLEEGQLRYSSNLHQCTYFRTCFEDFAVRYVVPSVLAITYTRTLMAAFIVRDRRQRRGHAAQQMAEQQT